MSDEPYDFEKEFQAVFIPKQKPPPEPNVAKMGATVSTYPPLGQVTQLKSGNFEFVACLEVERSHDSYPWEVYVWHSNGPQEQWSETHLRRIQSPEDGSAPTLIQTQNTQIRRLYFRGSFHISSPFHFTIRFRDDIEHRDRWAREDQGMANGIVIVNPEEPNVHTSSDFSDFMSDLNPDLKVKAVASQSPRTKLWTIEALVPSAKGADSSYADLRLGVPFGHYLRWFALVRIWSPWLAPRHGKDSFLLDKDAIMLSFLSSEGKHLVLLAFSGLNDAMTVFRHTVGQPAIHVRNDGEKDSTGLVLASVGDNFDNAMAAVMYHARDIVMATKGQDGELGKQLQTRKGHHLEPRWRENWYDGLGYCTWNALGQNLTDEKIFQALDKLAEHHVYITNLIIDDNWQDIDDSDPSQFQHGWNGFEAQPKSFPLGLKETVQRIRSKHPRIQHIAVWHALLGYWGGINPDSQLAKDYKTVSVVREESKRRSLPIGGPMTVIAKEDVGRFYDDFYRFLSSCGVDGVKTDAQFMPDMWTSAKHRRELINTYLDSWVMSSLRYFSIKAISCMSQTPQILFHSQLPRNRPAILVRNSDDFFPTIEKSHPWHIWTNAHNSLLTQYLNILPDWDMFQTVHDYSGFHAAGRCLSGGPIYITDVPGEHNIALITQMTAQTPKHKTIILRPSVVGRSLDQYAGYDDDTLLKVGCYHGPADTGTPIVGVFNISTRPLTELLPLWRFPGISLSSKYIVRSYSSGKVSPVLSPADPLALLPVTLDVRGYNIFTGYPLTQCHSEKRGSIYMANMGLITKMTGAAAIMMSSFEMLLGSRRVAGYMRLKALGLLGIYISILPDLTIEGNFMATLQGEVIPAHTVSIDEYDEHVLRIDLEEAYIKNDLYSDPSNEIELKLLFDI